MKSLKSLTHNSAGALFLIILLVLSGTVGVNVYFYTGVENRVKALRGSASMLANAITNPDDEVNSIEFWVGRGLNYSTYLNKEFTVDKATFRDVNKENFTIMIRNLQGYTTQSRYYSELIQNLTGDLVDQEHLLESQGTVAKGTSFESLLVITNKLVNTTHQIEITYAELVNASEQAKTGAEPEMNNLRLKAIELTNNYYQADALIGAAIISLPAVSVNVLAPFILIAVLYTVFLLFPWILLLLFFLRKKDNLIKAKIETFKDLELVEARGAGGDVVSKKLANEIDKQAFRTIEYLTSLMLLTIINGLLFYFVFYPSSSAGLAYLISTGGGVNAFATYLIDEATPITFGFLGAYFFVIQMLLRRYFSSDLTPKAYTSAVVRVLTVFILSIVLGLLSSTVGWALIVASVAAFVIGIFPEVGLRWIIKTTNKLSALMAPETLDSDPLTKIRGLNIWHESRLQEEKVENIQNLATASLDDLIINTNFCSNQLVDWIDQALLLLHISEPWVDSFRTVGIRTATGLLSCVCNNNGQLNSGKVNDLVLALNGAQTSHSKNPSPQMTREILEMIARTIQDSRLTGRLLNYWQKNAEAKTAYDMH